MTFHPPLFLSLFQTFQTFPTLVPNPFSKKSVKPLLRKTARRSISKVSRANMISFICQWSLGLMVFFRSRTNLLVFFWDLKVGGRNRLSSHYVGERCDEKDGGFLGKGLGEKYLMIEEQLSKCWSKGMVGVCRC